MKKLLSLLLCLAMVFGLAAPAMAADESTLPTIYLSGKANRPIYMGDGTLASNPDLLDREQYIMDAVGPILEELVMALATDDYSAYIDSLVNATAPIYKDLILDSDGMPQYGTHIDWDYKTAPIDPKASTIHFYYDWRLSPMEVSDQLDVFIERVIKATGKNGVNIHCRCMGSNFAMTYVAKSFKGMYDHPFRVKNIMLNTSGLGGYLTFEGLVSGSFSLSPDAVDRFVYDFLNGGELFEDSTISALAIAVVSLANTAKLLGYGTDFVSEIFNKIAPELMPKLALCCYGGYLSYWSMVGDDYYDKAKATVFNTPELRDEYKVFIEKIDAYHEFMSDTNPATGRPIHEDLLLDLSKATVEKEGFEKVGIAIIAKYGAPCVPLFDGSETTGDVRGTVTQFSFGATGTNIGSIFTNEYIEAAKAKGTYKYISPDLTVDASTGLFPDTTWFIKNIKHDQFPTTFNTLFQKFCASDGTMTVFSDENYPQYFDFVDGKVVIDKGEDPEDTSWSGNPFAVVIRFFTAIFNFFAKLFKR